MQHTPRGVATRSNRRRPVVLHALPVRPQATSTTSGARARTRHRARAVAHHSSGLFAKLSEKTTTVTPPTPPAPKPPSRNDTCAHGIIALTYASHPGRDDRFCRSLESAIRNGLDLRVLGWGVKWEGLSQKLGAALRAVEELPGDCPVVFTDAYDVLFTQGESAMRKAFDAIKADLVFSAECGCWPQGTRDRGRTCRDEYPPSPTPYRYLNSGSWAGKASVAANFCGHRRGCFY